MILHLSLFDVNHDGTQKSNSSLNIQKRKRIHGICKTHRKIPEYRTERSLNKWWLSIFTYAQERSGTVNLQIINSFGQGPKKIFWFIAH